MTNAITYTWLEGIRIIWSKKSLLLKNRDEFEELCASLIKIMWKLPSKGDDEEEQDYTRNVLFGARSVNEITAYLALNTKKERRTFSNKYN